MGRYVGATWYGTAWPAQETVLVDVRGELAFPGAGRGDAEVNASRWPGLRCAKVLSVATTLLLIPSHQQLCPLRSVPQAFGGTQARCHVFQSRATILSRRPGLQRLRRSTILLKEQKLRSRLSIYIKTNCDPTFLAYEPAASLAGTNLCTGQPSPV